jgi:hypothetical protein
MGEPALVGGQKIENFGVFGGPHHCVAADQGVLFTENTGNNKPPRQVHGTDDRQQAGNVMNTDLMAMSAPIKFDDVDYLTDLMLQWSQKHGRSMDDLMGQRHTILSRFRAGERRAERLFSDM